MKFTDSVLGAQVGMQLDSLPAHPMEKSLGSEWDLFSFDDFHQKKKKKSYVSYSGGW